jgi:hypothetical protein
MFCLLNYFHWFVYEILPYVADAVPSVGSKRDSSFDVLFVWGSVFSISIVLIACDFTALCEDYFELMPRRWSWLVPLTCRLCFETDIQHRPSALVLVILNWISLVINYGFHLLQRLKTLHFVQKVHLRDFSWLWERTAIRSLNSINWLVFKMGKEFVLQERETQDLYALTYESNVFKIWDILSIKSSFRKELLWVDFIKRIATDLLPSLPTVQYKGHGSNDGLLKVLWNYD